jgi:hypothetical protein
MPWKYRYQKPINYSSGGIVMPKVKILSVVLLIGLISFFPCLGEVLEIEIEVAPNVLNIQSNGNVVTVHTNLPYGDVVAGGVELNGIDIDSWKVDNRGYFVAKFLIDELKTLEGLRIDDYNVLTLTGVLKDDAAFIGTAEIMVIDIVPDKKSSGR